MPRATWTRLPPRAPRSYSWTVDLTPPAAPVVVSPAPNSTVDTGTPVFSGTAEPNSTVTIIIDGQVAGTVQADAAGNWSYTPTTPLAQGPHEVQVRTTDEAGNSSTTSAPSPFTVADTTAPETTITSGPSGTTSEPSATFEFGSNEPGVTFECSLDGAAYTPCTSPVTFTDLAEGEHTLQVRARDAAGNVSATPATRTWTVSAQTGGDIAFLGDGIGCSATGGDASLVLVGLGTFLTLARRRRRSDGSRAVIRAGLPSLRGGGARPFSWAQCTCWGEPVEGLGLRRRGAGGRQQRAGPRRRWRPGPPRSPPRCGRRGARRCRG